MDEFLAKSSNLAEKCHRQALLPWESPRPGNPLLAFPAESSSGGASIPGSLARTSPAYQLEPTNFVLERCLLRHPGLLHLPCLSCPESSESLEHPPSRESTESRGSGPSRTSRKNVPFHGHSAHRWERIPSSPVPGYFIFFAHVKLALVRFLLGILPSRRLPGRATTRLAENAAPCEGASSRPLSSLRICWISRVSRLFRIFLVSLFCPGAAENVSGKEH